MIAVHTFFVVKLYCVIYFIFVSLAVIKLTSFLLLVIVVFDSPFLLANAHNLIQCRPYLLQDFYCVLCIAFPHCNFIFLEYIKYCFIVASSRCL